MPRNLRFQNIKENHEILTMSRAINRHYAEKFKKKKHPAAKCGVAKCPVCHHHKYVGGNNKAAIKAKYRNLDKLD